MKTNSTLKTAGNKQPRKLTRPEFSALEDINEAIGAATVKIIAERTADLLREARTAQRAAAVLRRDPDGWKRFCAQGGVLRGDGNEEITTGANPWVYMEFDGETHARLLKCAKRLNRSPHDFIRTAVADELNRDCGPRGNLELALNQTIAFTALLTHYMSDENRNQRKERADQIECGLVSLHAHVERELVAACNGADAVMEAHLAPHLASDPNC